MGARPPFVVKLISPVLCPQAVGSAEAVKFRAVEAKISLEIMAEQPPASLIFTEKTPDGKPILGFWPLPGVVPQSKMGEFEPFGKLI